MFIAVYLLNPLFVNDCFNLHGWFGLIWWLLFCLCVVIAWIPRGLGHLGFGAFGV